MSNENATSGQVTANRRQVLAASAAGMVLVQAEAALAQSVPTALTTPQTGRDQPFDAGWLFHRGDGVGLEAVSLSDTNWRSLSLPHDWSIEDVPANEDKAARGPFSKSAMGGISTGFTLGGIGWYRKHFQLGSLPADARAELRFDGVYGECDIWLNGQHIAHNLHGYAPFVVDLTPAIKPEGDNVLAVRVRNLGRNSRWYSGSGIYRQVTLDVLPALAHFARDGVFASTRALTGGAAQIDVISEIAGVQAGLMLVTRLRDATGRIAAEVSTPAEPQTRQELAVRGPQLWSLASPVLYSLESQLWQGAKLIDSLSQPFGIRIVVMDGTNGLSLNGEQVWLRGACIHHDNGLLGACAFPNAEDRKVRLLKQRGFNAIRSSHNPSSRSLRQACDRNGMLLIEEAFDMWHRHKLPDDYATHFAKDWQGPLTAMVRAARNSPSVILWSIGNEIPDRSGLEGRKWAWTLANAVHQLDPTRGVTAGLNGTLGPVLSADTATARAGKAGQPDNAATLFLDVAGYNYRLDAIESDHAAHPDRLIYASETYPSDVYDYWQLGQKHRWFLGEFVWTAMDYLGEAGLGATVNLPKGKPAAYSPVWPWVGSWCGDIDLIGDQKPQSRYRDVVWGVSKLELAVQRPIPKGHFQHIGLWAWADELPSWNWPAQTGKPVTVRVYSSAQRVELRLNGKVVGRKTLTPADRMRAEFTLPYQPGTLEALAWSQGKVVGRKRLVTVGVPARLKLRVEPHVNGLGFERLTYVQVDIVDAQGRVVPDDTRRLSLSIDGSGQLAGFGSANPKAQGSFQANQAKAFRGRALAILRGDGAMRVTVSAPGLASATTMILPK